MIVRGGGRPKRYEIDGERVPSVTEIIVTRDPEGLVAWAATMGPSIYRARKETAAIGSVVHAAIEEHIHGMSESDCLDRIGGAREPWAAGLTHRVSARDGWHPFAGSHALVDLESRGPAQAAFSAYLKWSRRWQHLRYTHTECHHTMQIDGLGFGGTFDALGHDCGSVYLVDWKTGARQRQESMTQAAAYTLLVKDAYGIDVETVVIARFDRETGQSYEIVFGGKMLEHCQRQFRRDLRSWYAYASINRFFAASTGR